MKNTKLHLVLALTLVAGLSRASYAYTNAETGCIFMPPNNLHLQKLDATSDIDEKMFNSLIDDVVKVYEPVIDGHKGALKVNRLWKDETVNASASQSGRSWILNMYGGLARRPEVTPDGFQMVVCHELGHHLGGFPLKGARWAANEGQADYFATQACAHEIWKDQTAENAKARGIAPANVKAACDSQWKNENSQNLCYRTALAGQSLANLLAKLGNQGAPDFSKPDMTVVKKTDDNHPKAQCRLDTYYQGALCGKPFEISVIPGKDHPSGQQSPEAEQEAEKYSCGGVYLKDVGIRPNCWFKSQLHQTSSRRGGRGQQQPTPRRGSGRW